jgi:ComF family protein
VVPVPLSRGRLRQRGYNQSELIAAELARLGALPEPVPAALVRCRDNRPQVELPRAERLENVLGAFECSRPELVAGRRVLLIDDVSTTGATLEACAAPLIQAGAARVLGLVVAKSGTLQA